MGLRTSDGGIREACKFQAIIRSMADINKHDVHEKKFHRQHFSYISKRARSYVSKCWALRMRKKKGPICQTFLKCVYISALVGIFFLLLSLPSRVRWQNVLRSINVVCSFHSSLYRNPIVINPICKRIELWVHKSCLSSSVQLSLVAQETRTDAGNIFFACMNKQRERVRVHKV